MTLLPPSAIDGLRSARVRTRESGLVQVFSGACMKTKPRARREASEKRQGRKSRGWGPSVQRFRALAHDRPLLHRSASVRFTEGKGTCDQAGSPYLSW